MVGGFSIVSSLKCVINWIELFLELKHSHVCEKLKIHYLLFIITAQKSSKSNLLHESCIVSY